MFIHSQNQQDLVNTNTICRISVYHYKTYCNIEATLVNGEHINLGTYNNEQDCIVILRHIKHSSAKEFSMPPADDICF